MELLEYLSSKRDEIIKYLSDIIKIPSVSVEGEDGAPYGKHSAQALDFISQIAEREGLKVRNFDNHVVTATYGNTPEKLGVLSHVDVVPEGVGWNTDPFLMSEKDGILYGRGIADDKGAAVMSLWAVKAIKELGIKLNHGVRLIFGSGEETGCHDIEYYMTKEKMPPFVFSPDAHFPVINTEKGRFCGRFTAKYNQDNTKKATVLSFKGGKVINVVPRICEAVVSGVDKNYVLDKIECLEKNIGNIFSVSETDNGILIKAEGISAHASTPYDGLNAVTALTELVVSLELSGELFEILKKINGIFPHGDFFGKSIGAFVCDDISGESTFSLDIINAENGNISGEFDGRVSLNADDGNTVMPITEKFKSAGFSFEVTSRLKPHHVDKDSEFIRTLLNNYEKYCDGKAECKSMGGFTYVHGIENAVAFGPVMPGREANIHGANEQMPIDDIIKSTAIYAGAITDICR